MSKCSLSFCLSPDHSSSSGTLSFQPLRSQGPIPTAHVMPSPSSSKLSVPSAPSSPWSSCQLPSPLDSPLDMKDPRPVRRWSSLTRLTGQEKSTSSGRPSYRIDPHGSLDRGVLYGYRQDPLYSDGFLSESLHKLSTNSDFTKYDLGSSNNLGKTDSSCSSPLKPSTLDLTYSALPESKTPTMGLAGPGQRGTPLRQQAVGGSPIQPAVRTQMWLSEQMEYRPGPEGCGSWQQEQQQRERLRQEAELPQVSLYLICQRMQRWKNAWRNQEMSYKSRFPAPSAGETVVGGIVLCTQHKQQNKNCYENMLNWSDSCYCFFKYSLCLRDVSEYIHTSVILVLIIYYYTIYYYYYSLLN